MVRYGSYVNYLIIYKTLNNKNEKLKPVTKYRRFGMCQLRSGSARGLLSLIHQTSIPPFIHSLHSSLNHAQSSPRHRFTFLHAAARPAASLLPPLWSNVPFTLYILWINIGKTVQCNLTPWKTQYITKFIWLFHWNFG